MDAFTFILGALFVLMSILNLVALDRYRPTADILFVILCFAIGGVSLAKDHTDILGYVPIVMAVGWSIYATFQYRKKSYRSKD